MGVSELWSVLDPVRECVPLYSLAGKTLAVDLSLWVCEAQHVQGMMGKVTKPHLRNLFFRVSSLTLMGVKLVFVMEGDAPKIKAETMSKRSEMRFGPQKCKPAAAKNTSRGQFKCVLRECAEMLDCLGVPWVTAAGEAEAMCAFLDSQGVVDGCITNDGDVFLYGAQTVYRNFNTNTKDPQVDCYLMSRIGAELGLHRETLVGLAIFLGCDYIPKGVVGVGKEQTLKLIHTLNGQTLLQKFVEWSSDRPETVHSVTVKKVTHCLVCRHPGSVKSHQRSGCVFCTSERFCSPQDYDSKCPCEWHLTEGTRQAASIEANIRRKTLACREFPFTEVINEFLVMKDKLPSPFRRRKPNLMLMQNFALEKMDWPKHYSSQKVLQLLTYAELINRKHNRHTPAQMQPLRIYKSRVRHGINCFEVMWKKPDHYVFAEGCEQQTEVRTVEEESLFRLAFPQIVQEFFREKAEAQENKLRKKKAKGKKDEAVGDVMSDLFSQMSLQMATDLEHRVTQEQTRDVNINHPLLPSDTPLTPEIQEQLLPALPTPLAQTSLSDSALIGQLQLSTIDWDSSSFMVSPSQQPQSNKADFRAAGNGPELTVASVCSSDADLGSPQQVVDCPLEKQVVMKNVVKSNVLMDTVLQIHTPCKPDGSDITCSTADPKLSLITPCPKTQPHIAGTDAKTLTSLKLLQSLTAEHLQPTKQPLSSQNTERKPQSVCVRQGPFSDRDAENQPRSQKHKVKVTSKSLRAIKSGPDHLPRAKNPAQQWSSVTHKTPEKEVHAAVRHSRLIQRHHGKMEDVDSDVSVDSPLPLAERLKMRFAK